MNEYNGWMDGFGSDQKFAWGERYIIYTWKCQHENYVVGQSRHLSPSTFTFISSIQPIQ